MAGQQNFGTTYYRYYNESMPYIPKPSYTAAATLLERVPPQNYRGTVPANSTNNPTADVYVLHFQQGDTASYVVWAVGGKPAQCDAVEDVDKIDCGYVKITADACALNGCCFDQVSTKYISNC